MTEILEAIFASIWLFAPIGIANGMSGLAAKTPVLKNFNQPMDFEKTFRGKRILGSHKTIRGFVVGILTGAVFAIIQKELTINIDFLNDISLVDYSSFNIVLWGATLGFASLLGDSIKSFFKRQLDRKPGSPWVPFDQIDSILAGMVASLLFVQVEWYYYVIAFIVWVVITPLTNIVSYFLGLKDVWY